MKKDNTSKSRRIKKAQADFKNHVKTTKRNKLKNVRKQAKIALKATEELKFQQHMARLLGTGA